jgi:hypothetical protein
MQVFVILNLNDKLSKIRESLIQNSLIHMDNSLSFAKNNYELVKDEEKILGEIINMQDKILYLTTTMRECCSEKYKEYANAKWCKPCQINYLKKKFSDWTSENEKVNKFIQEMQLKINHPTDFVFEWIPYDQFYNIKDINTRDSTAVYLAKWKGGPLHWNIDEKKYISNSDKEVILKYLNNSDDLQIINEV